MTYVNTSRRSRLIIGGNDESYRMLNFSVSDSSAMNNGFVITSGEVILGTNSLTQFGYQKNRYKRGTIVTMDIYSPTLDDWERHPRGYLYVMGESFDPASQQITIALTCRLGLYASLDDATEVLPLSPLTLDESRQTFDNVRSAFASVGKILYQDNEGLLKTVDAFNQASWGDPATVASTWQSISDETTLAIAPLKGAAPIPDQIKLSYQYNVAEGDDEDAGVTTETNESTYELKYPGVIFTRVGSGKIPTDTTGDGGGAGSSICGNSPSAPSSETPGAGNAGTCSGQFQTVEEPSMESATRKEVITTTYGGPGKQVSSVNKKTYGPALEVNPQYYADLYAYCRFNYATACNPNGSCTLEGLTEVLQLETNETYTYNTDGSLSERKLEETRPNLAAAQPFDWRAGSIGGVPTSFTEISTESTFTSKITKAEYEIVDSKNKETITVSESSAVKSRAGIGATQVEKVQGGTLLLGAPVAYPTLSGTLSNLQTTTIIGNGTGMTVDATWPDASGEVKSIEKYVYTYNNKAPYRDRWAGGSGTGFIGSVSIKETYNSATGEYEPSEYTPKVENPGQGYTKGDLLTWTEVRDGMTNTFIIRVTDVKDGVPSLNINNPGSGYAAKDYLRIDSTTLTTAANQQVRQSIWFSVVGSPDSAVPGGNSIVSLNVFQKPQHINAGHYTNVPITIISGSGGGASVNIEAIDTGTIKELIPFETPRMKANEDQYIRSIGDYAFPVGQGSGRGLVVELGIGDFTGIGSLTPGVVVVRRIKNSGTGYKTGDIIEIPYDTLTGDFNLNLQTLAELRKPLKINVKANTGTIYVFPSAPGANFAVGDEFKITKAAMVAVGAKNTTVGDGPIKCKVARVSSEIQLGSLRLDAAFGIETVTVNTSSSTSTLPDAPDTTAQPSIATTAVETVVTVRQDQYTDFSYAGPMTIEEQIPTPLIMSDKESVEAASAVYGDYLKRWLLGEAMGVQVTESMTPDIMADWEPMVGFRYIDNSSNTGLALRADACSWGVSADEAAVSINGIWCGNVPTSGPETVLDVGDYVETINLYYNVGCVPTAPSVITPQLPPMRCDFNETTVVAVTGFIVSNGDALSPEGNGSIPIAYNGQLFVDGATFVDEDIFEA